MEPFLPWYIAGPLIGLIVPALLFLRQTQFGISSSFSFILNRFLPKHNYFKSARVKSSWQFHFAIGVILAGAFSTFLISPSDLVIHDLKNSFLTASVYEVNKSFLFLIGGLLTGFGARFANGCTAGNCIMGVSQFSLSSIIATVAFFVSGVLTAHFINPFIF